jgi:hypothetical protein
MQISLRQTGGSFGGERSVRIAQDALHVTDNGVAASRKLTAEEASSVEGLAAQLVKGAAAGTFPGDPYASDVMTTEVEIDDDDGATHRYETSSGGNAPTELWQLVGKLGEVADKSASGG